MSTENQFGEPWRVLDHSWAESSIVASDGKHLFAHSIDNEETNEENREQCEMGQARLLDRVISAVNLCAGHPDLSAVVVVKREDLEEVAGLLENIRDNFHGSILGNGCNAALETLRAILK